jgi:hypothetical protein
VFTPFLSCSHHGTKTSDLCRHLRNRPRGDDGSCTATQLRHGAQPQMPTSVAPTAPGATRGPVDTVVLACADFTNQGFASAEPLEMWESCRSAARQAQSRPPEVLALHTPHLHSVGVCIARQATCLVTAKATHNNGNNAKTRARRRTHGTPAHCTWKQVRLRIQLKDRAPESVHFSSVTS